MYFRTIFEKKDQKTISEISIPKKQTEKVKNKAKMGGCASKDKKDKIVEEDGTAGGIEGCVSNSMVFLAR